LSCVKTYGLLFASTAKGLAGQRRRLAGESSRYTINCRPLKSFEKLANDAIRIDPLTKPYKKLLNTWLTTPCPHHIAQIFAYSNPSVKKRNGLVPELSIGEVLALHPDNNIPEDLLIQLQGILLYPHPTTSEDYVDYPYFGEWLRHHNSVLQNRSHAA
jgi:hypothetical protein